MGRLIVIDGLDGCGKNTQAKILASKLTDKGYKVKLVSFPNYESLSSGPIRMYLNGEISSNPNDVNAYMASSFYVIDRAITFYKEIKKFYDDGYIIICDRYISSNIIYQSTKLSNPDELEDFIAWDYDFEVNKCGIPKEDCVICLTLPVETSQKLMTKRYEANGGKKDIHESDIAFLEKCHDNLDLICEKAVKLGYNYHRMDCSDTDGNIMDAEKISNMILEVLKFDN